MRRDCLFAGCKLPADSGIAPKISAPYPNVDRCLFFCMNLMKIILPFARHEAVHKASGIILSNSSVNNSKTSVENHASQKKFYPQLFSVTKHVGKFRVGDHH